MTNFTDSEIATIEQTFMALKDAMDNTPDNKDMLIKIDEVLNILARAKGNSPTLAVGADSRYAKGMNKYFDTKQTPVQSVPLPTGASAAVIQKTKALMNMFHGPSYYEPEPIGASVADKMVRDWKAKKTKQLFEMFHLA